VGEGKEGGAAGTCASVDGGYEAGEFADLRAGLEEYGDEAKDVSAMRREERRIEAYLSVVSTERPLRRMFLRRWTKRRSFSSKVKRMELMPIPRYRTHYYCH